MRTNPFSSKLRLPGITLGLATLCTLFLGQPVSAIDDAATLGVWRLQYGVSDAQFGDTNWMNADDDGDGMKNRSEGYAGTNPFLATSIVEITSVTQDGTTVDVTFPSVLGKEYLLQGSADMTAFGDLSPPVTGTGTGSPMVLSGLMGADIYFRVLVRDFDTDGDDLGDWVELKTSLNPNSATTTPGVNDHDYVMEQLALPNEVNITAVTPFASEDGPQSGKFMVSRTQKLLPVTVDMSVTGTAIPSIDYSPALPASVAFLSGESTNELSVDPMPNAAVEGSESVTSTLMSPPPAGQPTYDLGANSIATVIIGDSAVPTGTGLRGLYYDTASSNYANAANFNPAQLKIDRIDPTVDFDWLYGTPNGAVIQPDDRVDDYSVAWDGYLNPTTAGDYQFQLLADDKARVLLDTGGGLVQILEHGWDGPADPAVFNVSAPITLAVPGSPAARYHIRVEFVENTGDATCRLRWRRGTANFGNIPASQVFSHTRDFNYSANTSVVTVNTSGNHGLSATDPVDLHFRTGNLFNPPGYSGNYTVVSVIDSNSFTVLIPGAPNGSGAGYVGDSASTSSGYLGRYYPGTTLTPPARFVRRDTAVTNGNNGIWGEGTPDVALIDPTNFSVRWTGQMQPQFTEDYTITVRADNGCSLFINGELQELRAAAQGNAGGASYVYDGVTGDAVITYTNHPIVTGNILAGEIIRLDPTGGTLSSLGTTDYLITAATSNTFTVNFGTGTFGSGSGNMNIEMLNRPLKPWSSTGVERYVRLPLIGGVRYDIQLDYYEGGGLARAQLYWDSPSQPKQIIPSERLYPSTGTLAPTAHITPTDATALVGGPFSHPIEGSNGGSVSLSGNPPWLSYAGGELTGTPPSGAAGLYQIIVTITNADGVSTSIVNLQVVETDGQVTREIWSGVSGTAVADIPVGTAPGSTDTLTSLEAPTDFGDNYGARVRGHFTAPETGNYYFWLAASNAAELWISNDHEPVNAFKRAEVLTGNPVPQTWSGEAGQRSAWLALEQGQRYYFEILHKAGIGAGDNLAVGWSKPGESDTAPSEVVPGYTLDTYVPPAPGSTPGTLYVATMLAQGSAISSGVGSSTLRISEDETTAIMSYSYDNLTGPITSQHIHTDPYQGNPSTIVYDIDTPANPGDGLITDPQDPNFGSYLWTITPVGTLTAADIVEIIKQGKAYINLHTAAYPAGEIRGNYTLAIGSRTFTPPPPEPSYTDDHDTDAGAARFLTQATFGPNIDDIAALKAMPSYEAWIDDQFTKPASLHLPEVYRTEDANAQGGAFDERFTFNAWWWRSLAGDDQLRQRIAFALSEIHVVSAQGPLNNRADALSYFYDKLLTNAFGNFRDILVDTTLTPTMGRYLDMLRNDKPDQSLGRIPNENYAREIKQLFSVGLFRMWPDGTLILTSEDAPIDVYSQDEIIGFSHVFTGWTYGYDGDYRTNLFAPADWDRQMREVPARHFTGEKRILNNEVMPGLKTLAGQPLDPYAFHNVTHFDHPEYQALAAQELDDSHDQLFNHPNTGPFICRQLIQRLVTSHPSRDYLYRVVQAFNDNGSGVRGDMKAVIKQILLDYEARSTDMLTVPAYGKQREALMRVTAAGRAFRPEGFGGTYTQSDATESTEHQIFVTTTTPHGLANGNQVFLDFTSGVGGPAPWIGNYSVQSATTNSFRVTAKGWAFSTGATGYSIPAGSTTCTVTMNSHWLQAGHQVYVDFRTGAAAGDAGLDDTVYTVTTASPETGANGTFSFEIAPGEVSGTARTGACMIPRFSPGSYTARNSGLAYPNNRRVTMDTDFDHHLNVGDQVQLNFFAGNPLPLDAVVTVDTVEDLNTWTYLTNSDAATGFANNENNNGVYQFPLLSQPTNRNGDFGSRPSTFLMNNTDADLDQAPLNAPTVFNFFLPDFKNPGLLASQGITTPEFQTTAETTVIRQANYLYNGVFLPNSTNGYSSFRNGNNSVVMDLSPWMPEDATNVGLGNPDNVNLPWTHNQNIDVLIDHFSTLLTADQLSAEAKEIILDFVGLKISSINVGSPCIVNTVRDHGYQTGDVVLLSGVSGVNSRNGTFSPNNAFVNTTTTRSITVIDSDTFTVTGVNCTQSPTSLGLANAHVSQVPYNQGDTTPTTTHIRDRLRAVLHLILTSPDFTIQR